MFNSFITKEITDTEARYILVGPARDKRTFKVQQFSINDFVTRERPYLEKWEDQNGNYYRFQFGTNFSEFDYGRLAKIISSTGDQVSFAYNNKGHIIKAVTAEESLRYGYSEEGDLVEVMRMGNDGKESLQVAYDYQQEKVRMANNPEQTLSTHRIIRERKPEGRVLENDYDDQGRVSAQKATVGIDPVLARNAVFTYESTQEADKTSTGFTLVKDAYNNETRYEYTNGLITKITDPLGQTIHQEWYQVGDASPGAYPRSLKQYTDKRGFVTQLKYDPKGNAIERTTIGDITGDGVSDTATTKYRYNDNNLPISVIDPFGNEIATFYEDRNYPWLPTRIERKTQGQITSSIRNTYTERGLLQRQTIAAGTPDEATVEYNYNEQGFLINQRKSSGTGDPDVIMQFEYNSRGDLIKQIDDSGITAYLHDAMKKQTRIERRDKSDNLLAWEVIHYNHNGEPKQIDQSGHNPARHLLFQYDGAGRLKKQQISRNQADPELTDTKTAERYSDASTFYRHDLFGNLTEINHPEGQRIKMTYDGIGQMTSRLFYDNANNEQLAGETLTYEPGGEIATYTNVHGGQSKIFYTANGKPYRQENPDGTTQEWRYQFDGRLVKEILPDGSYWETNYNDLEYTVIRTLKDPFHQTLTQESYTFDRRGNIISYTDGENQIFTRQYDKLNRLISEIGPPATPEAAQRRTDIAYNGNTVTITNALEEKQILTKDALGRLTNILVQDADKHKISETTYTYSSEKNSITETRGLVSTATVFDTFDNPVLRAYADGNQQRMSYNSVGNLTSLIDELGTTTWVTPDIFQPASSIRLPNGGKIQSSLDVTRNTLELKLTADLRWKAAYSLAGKQLSEKLIKNVPENWTITRIQEKILREKNHSYYTSGPNIGRLQTTHDARNLEHTRKYNHFGRVEEITTTGSTNGNQKVRHDRRGLITSISQTSDEGEPVEITRKYSPYGDLIEETITINNQIHQKTTQKWDSAGRRTELTSGTLKQEFSYRADGQLTQIRIPDKNRVIDYQYEPDGTLKEKREANIRETLERDARGRIKNRAVKINDQDFLAETLNWRANSTLSNYQANGDKASPESRNFTYDIQGQLLRETYPDNTSETGEVNYAFDENHDNLNLGVRTRGNRQTVTQIDELGRPQKVITADGKLGIQVVGKSPREANIQLLLNEQKYDTVSVLSEKAWNVPIVLTPGTYQLKAEVETPGLTDSVPPIQPRNFRVGIQLRNIQYQYDKEGNLIQQRVADQTPNGVHNILGVTKDPWGRAIKIVKKSNSNITIEYSWDVWNRLTKIAERDDQNNGYNWSAVYDSFGRRLKTTYTPVTAGNPVTAKTQTLSSYYDPNVEFLEIGVKVNDMQPTWKVYGVDKDGTHGGLQGIGGLEAIITPDKIHSVIHNALGHVVATHDGTEAKQVPTRVGAYGPLPNSLALPLSSERGLHEVTHWLGKRIDETGFVYMGARYYDPTQGRFISPDPYGHFGSLGLYTYANNDPVNYCDPDGRLGKKAVKVMDSILGSPRIQGGLMFAGGIVGMFGGAALLAIPDLTFLTKWGGIALLGLSADSAATGLEQLRSNQSTQTLTSQGLQSVGAPPYYANMVSGLAEIVLAGGAIGVIAKAASAGKIGVKALHGQKNAGLLSSSDLGGVEQASHQLIASVGQRRAISWATPGSDVLRYLNYKGAEAAAFPASGDIFLRLNPSKAAILEEFLHGTQSKLGIIDRLGREAAEAHVKDFMIRHQKILGLSSEDVSRLQILKDMGL